MMAAFSHESRSSRPLAGLDEEVSVTKWLSAFTLAVVCVACGGSGTPEAPEEASAAGEAASGSASAPAAAAATKKPAPPSFREVTLPEGTALRLELRSAVASDSSQVEDTVRATLRQDVTIDGQVILPAGTEVVGTVTEAAQSGRVKGLARVAYRFNTLRHDSESYAIRTATIAHEAEPTKKEDATKIGVGAGVGAAVGAILGGGSGAAKGAAIGGAAGTGAVLATRGEEVRLGPGADVTTRLTAPLVVRVKS